MASQGERVPGGLDMCSNLESMARDGTYFYNFNSRGSSTPYPEHGLCRQTESRNGGTIAPQRGTEQAAISSAANGMTRSERSQQPPLQTTWAWQADIGGLRKQLTEEWETKLEEQKWKHNLEVKQLKEEVRSGKQIKESLERKIKRGEEHLEQGK